MHIVWHGHSMFKIMSKEATIVTDPYDSKMVGLTSPRPKADIVLVSHQHEDHNNVSIVKGEYKLISGPGEYEVKGVHIRGIETYHDDKKGAERGLNTVYVFTTEEMNLAHLGDLGQPLDDEQIEEIGEVDVLMIPVGGVYTIDHRQAEEVVNQIEPRLVIPMHYKIPKLKIKLDPVDKFLADMGASKVEPLPKLSLKKKDLPREETKVVLLEKA
jgi:L-ascorbate metabolism protein UlaG (beta-lactamase superfamily)